MKLLVDSVPIACGGGVQVTIAFLVNLRQQTDVEWHAVLPNRMRPFVPPEIAADLRVSFLQMRGHWDRILLRNKLLKIESAFAPDVVFTVFGPACFRARAPHVTGFALGCILYDPDGPLGRPTLSYKFTNWLRGLVFRQADYIIVETETVRRRLAQRISVDPSKISVIGNSVNPLLTTPASDDAPPSGRFAVLIPSTYYRHKNLEIVPGVAARMRKIDPDLDFEFRFTLEPESEPWRELSMDAEELGVADQLVTLGPLSIEELALAYRAASCAFLPTLRESSTAVYPESFFFRRPLITTDMDFARELCGDAAVFVPPNDIAHTAAQLVEMARSPELRTRLVEAGVLQLARAYPGHKEKFAMQISVLSKLAQRDESTRRWCTDRPL